MWTNRPCKHEVLFEPNKGGAAGYGEWTKPGPIGDIVEVIRPLIHGVGEMRHAGAVRIYSMSISKESSNTTGSDGQGEDNSNSKDLEYDEMTSPQYHGRKKWHRKPHMVAGITNLTHQWIVPHGKRHPS